MNWRVFRGTVSLMFAILSWLDATQHIITDGVPTFESQIPFLAGCILTIYGAVSFARTNS